MGKQYHFGPGTKFELDGDHCVVESLNGSTVCVRCSSRGLEQHALADLFNSEGFKIDGAQSINFDPPISGVPEATLAAARKLEKHLLEAITGYRSGTSQDPAAGEPRPEFDPIGLTLSHRMRCKASELGLTERAMWRLKNAYEKQGVVGLVDKRALRRSAMLVDERIRLVLIEVIDSFENLSNPSNAELQRLTENKIKERYPDLTLPSEATFNRLVAVVGKGKGLDNAKQRRSIANRPETPYGHYFVHRPGQLVVIDSTPLDAYAMDPYNFLWIQVQLTIALDLFSRSILAWRFTPVSTKAVDAALLLYDILRPKRMLPSWRSGMKWAYAGIPEAILIELTGSQDQSLPLAALPFLHPESVLVDRAKVFLSDAFMSACRVLGIDLLVARPRTPTDKPHVERVFKTIHDNFVDKLKGYKGSDIRSRGLNVEAEAFWFIDEIDEKFGEWVGEYYQNRFHQGLNFPEVPRLKISPNHMLQEGISRAGFVAAPPAADLFYRLLPVAWKTIQHYGVDTRRLRYDGDILKDFRNMPSPYTGRHEKKWPFPYDPRDLSVIYFQDPETAAWHTLHWTGAGQRLRPFADKTLSYAKSLVLARHLDPNSQRDLTEVLNELIDRIDSRQMQGAKERRVAALHALQTANAAKDRGLAPPSVPPDSTTTSEEDDVEEEVPYDENQGRHPKADEILGSVPGEDHDDVDEDDDDVDEVVI